MSYSAYEIYLSWTRHYLRHRHHHHLHHLNKEQPSRLETLRDIWRKLIKLITIVIIISFLFLIIFITSLYNKNAIYSRTKWKQVELVVPKKFHKPSSKSCSSSSFFSSSSSRSLISLADILRVTEVLKIVRKDSDFEGTFCKRKLATKKGR